MRRGEIWTVAGGGDYVGKPRPVAIVQDDRFDVTESITICPLTTEGSPAPLARIVIEPNELNGLAATSLIMVDKVTTVRRDRMGTRVGELSSDEIAAVNRAIAVFLGLAERRRRGSGSSASPS